MQAMAFTTITEHIVHAKPLHAAPAVGGVSPRVRSRPVPGASRCRNTALTRVKQRWREPRPVSEPRARLWMTVAPKETNVPGQSMTVPRSSRALDKMEEAEAS